MPQSALVAGFIPENFGEQSISVAIPKFELSPVEIRNITTKIKNALPNRYRTCVSTISGECYYIFSLRIRHLPSGNDYMKPGLDFCDALEKVLARRIIIDNESIPKP